MPGGNEVPSALDEHNNRHNSAWGENTATPRRLGGASGSVLPRCKGFKVETVTQLLRLRRSTFPHLRQENSNKPRLYVKTSDACDLQSRFW